MVELALKNIVRMLGSIKYHNNQQEIRIINQNVFSGLIGKKQIKSTAVSSI